MQRKEAAYALREELENVRARRSQLLSEARESRKGLHDEIRTWKNTSVCE